MNTQQIKDLEDFVLNHRELFDAIAVAFGKFQAALIKELTCCKDNCCTCQKSKTAQKGVQHQ